MTKYITLWKMVKYALKCSDSKAQTFEISKQMRDYLQNKMEHKRNFAWIFYLRNHLAAESLKTFKSKQGH